MFERSMKLRETAIEEKILQAAYSFLKINNYFQSPSLARPPPFCARGARHLSYNKRGMAGPKTATESISKSCKQPVSFLAL